MKYKQGLSEYKEMYDRKLLEIKVIYLTNS